MPGLPAGHRAYMFTIRWLHLRGGALSGKPCSIRFHGPRQATAISTRSGLPCHTPKPRGVPEKAPRPNPLPGGCCCFVGPNWRENTWRRAPRCPPSDRARSTAALHSTAPCWDRGRGTRLKHPVAVLQTRVRGVHAGWARSQVATAASKARGLSACSQCPASGRRANRALGNKAEIAGRCSGRR
jgi:hypothetical protein